MEEELVGAATPVRPSTLPLLPDPSSHSGHRPSVCRCSRGLGFHFHSLICRETRTRHPGT